MKTPRGAQAKLRTQAVAVATARIASLLAAAIQLPLLTRLLPPDDYAFVAAALAMATYVSLLSGDATTLAFRRFPGSFDDRGNYAFGIRRIRNGFLAAALLVLTVGWLLSRWDLALAVTGWAAGLVGMRYVSTAWIMWQRGWWYAGNLMASTTARTAVLLCLLFTGSSTYMAVAAAGATSCCVAVISTLR